MLPMRSVPGGRGSGAGSGRWSDTPSRLSDLRVSPRRRRAVAAHVGGSPTVAACGHRDARRVPCRPPLDARRRRRGARRALARAGPPTSWSAPCSTGSAPSTGCPSRPPPTPCAARWSTRCWRTSSTSRGRPHPRAGPRPARARRGTRCSSRSPSREMLVGGGPTAGLPDLARQLRDVLDRYFTLEDPRRLEPAERELYVEALLDSRLLLRGFVDRLDVAPDGRSEWWTTRPGELPARGSRPRRCSR